MSRRFVRCCALVWAPLASIALGCASHGGAADEVDASDELPLPLPPVHDPPEDAGCWGDGAAGAVVTFLQGEPSMHEGGVGAWLPFVVDVTLPSGKPGTLADAVVVFTGGVPGVTVGYDDAKHLLFTAVPPGAQSGDLVIAYGCELLQGDQPFFLDEVPAPVITSISPDPAAFGGVVQLSGSNFTGATKVTFGGAEPASPLSQEDFTVVDDNTILVQFDVDAGPGAVGVTTPSGTSYSDGGLTVSP